MIIFAIDPGNEKSAFVLYDTEQKIIIDKRILDNGLLLVYMRDVVYDELAIEMIASYGMPVGKTVFDTCLWVGRFVQAALPCKAHLIYRKDEKMFLCASMKAKDSNIRQALIDLLGKETTKGCSKDIWAALAVAITFYGTRNSFDRNVTEIKEIPF
jgi:hypothetical protein